MRVRLSAAIVSDESALSLLDDILRFFEAGRHQWVIDDIEGIERSTWVEQAGRRQSTRILDLLRKVATEAAYGDTTHTIEIEIGTGEGRVTPSMARDAMARPAYLIVENATSDGRFLRALIHAYDNPRLRTAVEAQWLEIDQAGGVGEVPKRVHALIHDRAADRRRIQALVDSDRRNPKDDSDTVKRMRMLEQEHGVVVHILHKRDSENYLPLDALAHHKHEADRFQKTYKAFSRLSPHQQDHFDMKSGFKASPNGEVTLHTDQVELFAGIRGSVLRDLVGGFGNDCGCWFEDDGGKVPRYIDRTTLEARCSTKPGELPAILAKLEEIL